MSILVLGGAGYIGSHMVSELLDHGEDVVVVDNLSRGHQAAVPAQVKMYMGDIRNRELLKQVFTENQIEAVFHFWAFIQIPESLREPNLYFDNNVYGLITLIDVMKENRVDKLIFSSSAAVYGVPEKTPIEEDDAKNPINPYGQTKLMMEQIMQWDGQVYGINWLAFRYFNVAGAKLDGSIGEDHRPESHLIPIVLQAAKGIRSHVDLCGNDYQTRDGYNVRDYVHVLDLVNAHFLGLNYLRNGGKSDAFNIGSKQGFTVKEIVDAARTVLNQTIVAIDAPRRGGDPDELVANSEKIRQTLGWTPQYTNLECILQSAWHWLETHPAGYPE